MSDAIIEAAAQAVQRESDYVLGNDNAQRIATAVLAAAAPLIRAQVLEEAARAAEKWTGQILSPTIGDHYAFLIRALKEQP